MQLGAVGKFRVQYRKSEGVLDLLVVEGKHMSLLGLPWLVPLSIQITGVNSMEKQDFRGVCDEFPAVFDGTLGRYTAPPFPCSLTPRSAP